MDERDLRWDTAWPEWMREGICFDPESTLRMVVDRTGADDVLECGHKVEILDEGPDVEPLPVGSYRRGCVECGHPPVQTDIWFPPKSGRVARIVGVAKSYCDECPVTVQCADYAIDNRIRTGIWGGMTYHMRKRIVDY